MAQALREVPGNNVPAFDAEMYRAALAYYGLPADYKRTFKQKVYPNNQKKPTLISCDAATESARGNSVWVQVNRSFDGASMITFKDGTKVPKKPANADIEWIANITFDFEYPTEPDLSHMVASEFLEWLIANGYAEPGTADEDTGGGDHIVIPIPPIQTKPETAETWNKAVTAAVKKYIQPEFDRLVKQYEIEMDLGGYDISRVLSAPGTWRPYRPDKKDCDMLQSGYLRRWLPPYTYGNYPERRECAKLAQLIRDEYEKRKTPDKKRNDEIDVSSTIVSMLDALAGTSNGSNGQGWIKERWDQWVRNNLEVRDTFSDGFEIKCPWSHLHTTPGDTARVYYGPPFTFNCFHDHCKGRKWPDVRELVEPRYKERQKPPTDGEIKAGVEAEKLCSYDADDSGNSDAMQYLYGQEGLWCHSRGWFIYNGRYWKHDPDASQTKSRAITTLRKRRHAAVDLEKEHIIACTKASDKNVNGCLSLFKTHVSVGIDEFDNNPDLINCNNGVVDLRTGEITSHSSSQRFTYCIKVDYDPAADTSVWLEYLNGVVGGGQTVLDYFQLALGYSFTGHTREEILFYLYGKTRSGKGTVAETIMSLLPAPISTMVDFSSFTAKREGDVSNFDLAPLKPSRVIFASESNRSQSLNPAKIKQLTGGDKVRACFKHKDFFEYRPQFKVWMMSNHPVNGDPEDEALWGRVRVIEFPNSYLGIEDKTKKENLKKDDNLSGILAWIVQGAIKWYALGAVGLDTPKEVKETTQKHRDDLDYVQQWLDAKGTRGGADAWVSNETVMLSYTNWCKDNNVQYPKGPKALSQSLEAKGYYPGLVKKIGGKSKRGIGGLNILED